MLEIALNWLKQGIAPIPIAYKDKFPYADLLPIRYDDEGNVIYRRDGITPKHTWEPYAINLPTEDEVKWWFGQHKCNLGIVCGWQNLVVLDFDNWDSFSAWLPKHTFYAHTYSVLTSRGIHLYYFVEDKPRSTKVDGIDVKANGYVLTYPSIHPSGVPYAELEAGRKIMRVSQIKELVSLPHTEFAPACVWRGGKLQPSGRDLISKIKGKVSIFDVLPLSCNPRESGDGWYMAHCPFHDDRSPSFWIDARRGLCGCFAGCTPLPLDVIDLLADLENISLEDAIWELAEW